MRVEALIVIAVTPFYFTIVSRCSWTNMLVRNPLFLAVQIEGMCSTGFPEMGKFNAIIHLYDFWLIATLKLEFRVQINERDGWILSDEILYPSFFLLCMGIRMRVFGRRERSVSESIVPSKRRFQRIREAFEIL